MIKGKTQDPRITQKVIEMVAAHYRTTPDVLKTEDGERKARQAIMYILKEELGGTLRAAREAINVKSDPTVYSACKAIKALLGTDAALATMIEEIKTEALMITAMPGGGLGVAPVSGEPTSYKRRIIEPRASSATPMGQKTSTITTNDTMQVIGNVQKAVTSVFLGADLLQSRDPAAEVMLAKDAVVFLVWDDFPKIPLSEILSAFHLDQDGLYRAIGRISVCIKEDGNELKKKLRAVRGAYSPA